MPDVEWWTAQSGRTPGDRFPEWAIGRNRFTEAVIERMPVSQFAGEVEIVREADRKLHEGPRVFVSHKREDKAIALAIARVAHRIGFDYWLDVEDPNLQALGRGHSVTEVERARLTALIIEMALLNCSHVIAVLTKATAASRWVPYEFGRIKDKTVFSERAASFSRTLQPVEAPEYHALGRFLKTESALSSWLESELVAWRRKFGPRTRPQSAWAHGEGVTRALEAAS